MDSGNLEKYVQICAHTNDLDQGVVLHRFDFLTVVTIIVKTLFGGLETVY